MVKPGGQKRAQPENDPHHSTLHHVHNKNQQKQQSKLWRSYQTADLAVTTRPVAAAKVAGALCFSASRAPLGLAVNPVPIPLPACRESPRYHRYHRDYRSTELCPDPERKQAIHAPRAPSSLQYSENATAAMVGEEKKLREVALDSIFQERPVATAEITWWEKYMAVREERREEMRILSTAYAVRQEIATDACFQG